MAAVETKGLVHRYGGVSALRDVTLVVPEGSVSALLGPNGAGKTTLLRILVGLLRASGGSAHVLGRDVRRTRPADRAEIGYVAEGQRLPRWMRLGEFERYLAPLYPGWDHALAASLRGRFRLDERRRLGALSRGEQMKCALLLALAARPRLLLLDEPFTGMDVAVKDELVRGLLGAAAGAGVTVLVSSHDLVELETLADHVAFLDAGRLLLARPLDELRESYRMVEVVTADGAAPDLPAPRLLEERAGRRISFLLADAAGDVAAELRRRNPGLVHVEVRGATLREVFLALTRAHTHAAAEVAA